MTLRSSLNPEEQTNRVVEPTKYKKGPNRFELICGLCGGRYYVNEVVFRQAMSAMEMGIENPFSCDDCEAEKEDFAH